MFPSPRGNPRRTQADPIAAAASTAVLVAGALGWLASCAPSRPPAPDALTALYRPISSSPRDETYAAALGFREIALRQGPGATDPFPVGAALDGAVFNAHLPPPAASAGRSSPILTLLPATSAPLPAEASLDLIERCTDALRAAGFDARRDAVLAGAPLLEPPLRALRPRLLRSEIAALAIDGDEARLDARLWLEDASGQRLAERRCQLHDRAPALDPLGPLGVSLAACLLSDAPFRNALAGSP